MEFKIFVNQLSQIKEAISVTGKHYTDIHISASHINYTRESNSHEKIDIQELFEVYEKENYINTTILRNYVTGRKFSPALAILMAAGFYNENGEKQTENIKLDENHKFDIEKTVKQITDNKDIVSGQTPKKRKNSECKLLKLLKSISNLRVLNLVKRLIASLFLIIPVIIILCSIHFYSPEPNRADALFWISVILVIINGAFFLYLIIFKDDPFKEVTYTAYFTLMIFNVGIFPLFNYIKDYQERNTQEVIYTAGFRSWGSTVKYYDIEVSYYDKFGNPYSLDTSIVRNPDNWMPYLWKEDNISAYVDTNALVNFNKTKDEFSITISNCGAVIKAKLFDPKAVSFFIDAKIKLLEVDSSLSKKPDSLKYHSSQFCLKVPYNIKKERFSDIYYGFEFFFSNITMSKLRIPGLNFDYTYAELYYLNKYNQNTYAKNIIKNLNTEILHREPQDTVGVNREIHLSALLFDDNAAFNVIENKSTISLPIFNFNISKYGAFNLIEK